VEVLMARLELKKMKMKKRKKENNEDDTGLRM
jgi:hypothetical protein